MKISPSSFYSYITQKDKKENVITGMHPNEYGHDLWTEELNNFIKENNVYESCPVGVRIMASLLTPESRTRGGNI